MNDAFCIAITIQTSSVPSRLPTLTSIGSAVNLTLNPVNVQASVLVRSTRARNINILNVDVRANRRAGADQVTHKRVVLLAGRAVEVLDRDVRDGEVGGELLSR